MIFGALLLCAPVPAFAQDQGDQPQAQAQNQAPPPDSQVVLPAMKGLRFIDVPSKLQKNGFQKPGIIVDGPNILYSPGVYQQLQSFLGKPLKEGDLKTIVKVVTDWYTKRNHPYVDVTFADQDADNGIVQVLVTEFRAGQIKVQGNDWFAASIIRSQIHLQPGQRINAQLLNNDLTYLNESDFRDVHIELQRGTTEGTTDLLIQTGDK